MIEFYCMITLQCCIFGISFYFWFKSLVLTYISVTWSETLRNFLISIPFLFAMFIIDFYWSDTIKTNNTFFSKPVYNLIELQVK